MKILVSSLSLASYLHAFDYGECPVERVGYFDGKLRIESSDYAVDVHCEIIDGSRGIYIDQSCSRWDWLEKTLRNITEQPIVLEFGTNRLNLIISY